MPPAAAASNADAPHHYCLTYDCQYHGTGYFLYDFTHCLSLLRLNGVGYLAHAGELPA